jgi:hypothetical protein
LAIALPLAGALAASGCTPASRNDAPPAPRPAGVPAAPLGFDEAPAATAAAPAPPLLRPARPPPPPDTGREPLTVIPHYVADQASGGGFYVDIVNNTERKLICLVDLSGRTETGESGKNSTLALRPHQAEPSQLLPGVVGDGAWSVHDCRPAP